MWNSNLTSTKAFSKSTESKFFQIYNNLILKATATMTKSKK